MIFIRSLTLQCVQWRGIDCIVLSIACSKLSVKANWVHVKKVPPSFRRKILSQQINVGPWLWNYMKMFSINKRNVFNVGPNVCLTSWHQSGQHSFLNTLKHSLFSQTKSIFRTELCRSSVQSFGRKHPGSASSLAEEYNLSQGTVEVPSSRATQRLEAWAVPCRWTGRRWTSSSERWPSLAPLRSKGETLLACGCARELHVWCCSKVAVSLCQHTHTLHLTVHRLGSLKTTNTQRFLTCRRRDEQPALLLVGWLVGGVSRTWPQEAAAAGWCHQRAPQNLQSNCTTQKRRMRRSWRERRGGRRWWWW